MSKPAVWVLRCHEMCRSENNRTLFLNPTRTRAKGQRLFTIFHLLALSQTAITPQPFDVNWCLRNEWPRVFFFLNGWQSEQIAGSGRWALKNIQRGYFLGSSQDELKCTAKAPGEAEYWLVHLAARPQVRTTLNTCCVFRPPHERSVRAKLFAQIVATTLLITVFPRPIDSATIFLRPVHSSIIRSLTLNNF